VRWLILAAGAASLADRAAAGAWTQPPGHSQQISTLSREVGDFGETWRSDYLAEYGFASGWGAHVKLENQIRIAEIYDDRFSLEAGLRRSFAVGPRGAIALQASVLGAEAIDGPDCDATGYEGRLAWGASRSFGARNGFVNVETGWRSRGPGCERMVIEAAVGLQVAKDWRVIGKAWSEDGDGARSAKVEASVLRDMGEYSFGLGYRREVSGAFEEDGLVVAAWRRF